MGAVTANAEIARGAEHLAPDPAGRTVDHDSSIVPARRARKYRVGHRAGSGFDIGRIDGRRLEFDQHLVGRARQRTPLDPRREQGRGVGLGREAHAARLDRKRPTVWLFRD